MLGIKQPWFQRLLGNWECSCPGWKARDEVDCFIICLIRDSSIMIRHSFQLFCFQAHPPTKAQSFCQWSVAMVCHHPWPAGWNFMHLIAEPSCTRIAQLISTPLLSGVWWAGGQKSLPQPLDRAHLGQRLPSPHPYTQIAGTSCLSLTCKFSDTRFSPPTHQGAKLLSMECSHGLSSSMACWLELHASNC